MELTADEHALVTAFRERGQGGVLEWLGKRCPPPKYALDDVKDVPDDVFEIDAHPMSSEADGGCWVSCWAWVSAPDQEEDEDAAPSLTELSGD